MALIIDSRGFRYLGLKHMDYFLDRSSGSNPTSRSIGSFRTSFRPSWWMEYGWPRSLGARAKIKFWQDNTERYHTLYHIEDMELWPDYEVEADAFMG